MDSVGGRDYWYRRTPCSTGTASTWSAATGRCTPCGTCASTAAAAPNPTLHIDERTPKIRSDRNRSAGIYRGCRMLCCSRSHAALHASCCPLQCGVCCAVSDVCCHSAAHQIGRLELFEAYAADRRPLGRAVRRLRRERRRSRRPLAARPSGNGPKWRACAHAFGRKRRILCAHLGVSLVHSNGGQSVSSSAPSTKSVAAPPDRRAPSGTSAGEAASSEWSHQAIASTHARRDAHTRTRRHSHATKSDDVNEDCRTL